jgi:hypothetical protein
MFSEYGARRGTPLGPRAYCNRTATGPVRGGTQRDKRLFKETKNRVNKPGNET